jgi:phosphoserine phosphatase RsbU/P
VGGDWYDYLNLGDGFWGIALGDVCGKGMAAALLMSATRSLFRMAAEGLESPSEVLMHLNEALLKDLPEGRFVTLIYSILDTKRATVRVANGGHPYPIFVRGQTNITELKTERGFPLGLMNSEYSEVGLTLQTGDRVLMYTDGAVEATNAEDQEYGTSRLVKSLQKPGVQPSRCWPTCESSRAAARSAMMPPRLSCAANNSFLPPICLVSIGPLWRCGEWLKNTRSAIP